MRTLSGQNFRAGVRSMRIRRISDGKEFVVIKQEQDEYCFQEDFAFYSGKDTPPVMKPLTMWQQKANFEVISD